MCQSFDSGGLLTKQKITEFLKALGRFLRFVALSLVDVVKTTFGIRDIFIFGGISMLGYGLHLYLHWLGFAISGGILLLLGLGWITRIPISK